MGDRTARGSRSGTDEREASRKPQKSEGGGCAGEHPSGSPGGKTPQSRRQKPSTHRSVSSSTGPTRCPRSGCKAKTTHCSEARLPGTACALTGLSQTQALQPAPSRLHFFRYASLVHSFTEQSYVLGTSDTMCAGFSSTGARPQQGKAPRRTASPCTVLGPGEALAALPGSLQVSRRTYTLST